MHNIATTLQDQFQQTYHWAEGIGVSVKQETHLQMQRAQKFGINAYHTAPQIFKDTANDISPKCQETLHKIEQLLSPIQHEMHRQMQRTQKFGVRVYHAIGQGCQDTARYIGPKCRDTLRKIERLLYKMQQGMYRLIRSIQSDGAQVYHAVGQRCHNTAKHVASKCRETIDKIEWFLYQNKETIFLTSCSLATAYFCPYLFFPAAIVGTFVRIEVAYNLKNAADYFLKAEHNPYRLHPQYDKCVNSLEMAIGTVAAIDAIALGTLFVTNCWSVYLVPPILGGLAAGSAVAKMGMNFSHFLAPTSELEKK